MNIYEYLRLKGNIPQAPGLGVTGIQLPQAAAGPAMVGRGGPLAPPQAPPPTGRGFLGAIDDVFGGPDMKNLTPEQRKAARRKGLLAFGAQMLTATDPRGNRAQGLSALGQGIMAAQGGYGQGIEQGMAQNQAQQEAQMWAQLAPQPNESPDQTRARLQMVLSRAIQTGNTKVVTAVSEVLKSLSPKEGQQARLDQVRAGGKVRMVDPFTGKTVIEYDDPDADRGPSDMFLALERQRRVQNSNALNDDYMKEQTPYYDAYQPITEALALVEPAKAGNAAAQINLVYAFITALDRRSTVREGEVNLVRGASSVKQRIDQLKDKYGSLEAAVIPDELVSQIAGILRTSSANLEKGMQDTERRYQARAQDAGVSPGIFRPAPSQYYVDPDAAAKKYGGPK